MGKWQNTVIGYYIPSNSKSASIIISTLTGVQIQAFPIEVFGKGQVIVSAGVLAAGNYLYTLIVNGQKVDTKKMMIVKE